MATQVRTFRFADRPFSIVHYTATVTSDQNALGRWAYDILVSEGFIRPDTFNEFLDGNFVLEDGIDESTVIFFGLDTHSEDGTPRTLELFWDGSSCIIYRLLNGTELPFFLQNFFCFAPFTHFWTAQGADDKRASLLLVYHLPIPENKWSNLEGALEREVEPEHEFFGEPQKLEEDVAENLTADHIKRIAKRSFYSYRLLWSRMATQHYIFHLVDHPTSIVDYTTIVTSDQIVLGRWAYNILVSESLIRPQTFTDFLDGTFLFEDERIICLGLDTHTSEDGIPQTLELFFDGRSCIVYLLLDVNELPFFLRKFFCGVPFIHFRTAQGAADKRASLQLYLNLQMPENKWTDLEGLLEGEVEPGHNFFGEPQNLEEDVAWQAADLTEDQIMRIAERSFYTYRLLRWLNLGW